MDSVFMNLSMAYQGLISCLLFIFNINERLLSLDKKLFGEGFKALRVQPVEQWCNSSSCIYIPIFKNRDWLTKGLRGQKARP